MNPDWIEQARRLVESFGGLTGHATTGGSGADAAECRWCPLCQFLAVLRGERPEVAAALADILTATANALHAFAAAPDEAPPSGPEKAGAESAGDPPPVVQRIEIA